MGTGTEIYRCLLFAGGDDIYYESERGERRWRGTRGKREEGSTEREKNDKMKE